MQIKISPGKAVYVAAAHARHDHRHNAIAHTGNFADKRQSTRDRAFNHTGKAFILITKYNIKLLNLKYKKLFIR